MDAGEDSQGKQSLPCVEPTYGPIVLVPRQDRWLARQSTQPWRTNFEVLSSGVVWVRGVESDATS